MKRAFATLGVVATFLPAVVFAAPAATTVTAQTYWGTEFSGPVGVVPVYTKLSPTAVSIPDRAALVQVGSSNSTEYALLSDGSVWAWGVGAEGQLGNDTSTAESTSPVKVRFPAGVTIKSLATDAMPFNAALAIDTNGNVWGWGDTATGSLCNHGKGVPIHYLLPVKLPLTNVTMVAGASAHTIFDSNGSLFACGGIVQYSALGTGLDANAYTPTAVVGMHHVSVVGVYASSVDSYTLLTNGQVWAWGQNNEDQLGNGTSGGQSDVPVLVSFTDSSPVVQAAAGGDAPGNGSVLVKLADGTLWSWGAGNAYQLGNGISGARPSPVEFFAPAGVTYNLIAASGADGYAVDTTGAVWSWGQGQQAEIGDGARITRRLPVEVVTGGVTMISVTAQDVAVG